MDNVTFSLDDLAQLSGLSTRAIRDYIARGLVPPSNGLGRAASYSQEHLDRLLAVRALRERGRSLQEIEQFLASGSPDELRSLASEARQETSFERRSSPLEYIRSISGVRPVQARPKRPAPALASAPAGNAEALSTLAAELAALAGPAVTRPSARSAEWVRVRVTPDFELSARGPLDMAARLALERVADALRTLMQPPTKEGEQ